MFLRGIQAHGYHGVFDLERAQGQRFIVDVDWWIDIGPAVRKDKLAATLCYKQIYDAVIAIIVGQRCALIEALADRIATDLFGRFAAIGALRITLHKPDAPIGGPFSDVGICMFRERV